MGIFGGWNKDEKKPVDFPKDIEDIKNVVDNTPNMRMSHGSQQDDPTPWRPQPEEWNPQQPPTRENWEHEQQDNTPVFAPLFVKIDRYRNILSAITSIKTTVVVIRNSLGVMMELDKARQQAMSLMRDAMEKVDKRLSNLDNELVRPSGFTTQTPMDVSQDVHGVENTLSDLKSQIAQLKNELQQM